MAEFDFQGARAAGYSNDEILRYLASPGIQPVPPQQPAATPGQKLRQRVDAARARGAGAPALTPINADLSGSDNYTPDEAMRGKDMGIVPGWLSRASGAINEDLSHSTGLVSEADLPALPQSKTEAALLAAGALIPGGKVAKGARAALKIGTSALEGAAPEVGLLSRGTALTGGQVLREAAAPTSRLSFSDFRKRNPEAGAGMFDLANAQPAIPASQDLPRYEPPRGIPERLADALASRTVRNRLVRSVERGGEMMPESWYRTSPLYQEFVKEYGPEEAEQHFRTLIDHVSASSPGMKIPDNIRTGSYYNYIDRQGMPVPETPAAGYGAKTQQLHMQNERNLRAGGLDPLQNPKPASFIENLTGNERPVTIDTHNFRALGMAAEDPRFLATSAEVERRLPDGTKVKQTIKPRQMFEQGKLTMKEALKQPTYWVSDPAENEYGAYEQYQQRLADKMGITPSTWQERMWVGAGEKTGLGSPPEPFLRTLAARIHYTAARLNADPQVILKKFIRGEIPLLEVGAAAAGLGAAGAAAGGDDAQPRGQR